METSSASWRQRLYRIIYNDDTPAGKAFDIALLALIIASIVVVTFDSVKSIHVKHGSLFNILEWSFTVLFTIEYILRIISIKKPWQYITSWLGIIDLLTIVPSYLSIFYAGAQSLLVFRALRLLRIFRIFKLTHFLTEMQFLQTALRSSLKKIAIFMLVVLTLVIILGSVMYLIEGPEHGFNSIPDSIYWAVVTITTVGYGDISPVTPAGKFVASFIMFIGYGIIAVPTGIVTNEMAAAGRRKNAAGNVCPVCGLEGQDDDARYCKRCGTKLEL